MANKIRMIRKPRRKRKQSKEPNILERLKKLSDSAPVVEMRGGINFDGEDMKFKDK